MRGCQISKGFWNGEMMGYFEKINRGWAIFRDRRDIRGMRCLEGR